MFDIGVDLAWGVNAWTGLAALDETGRLLHARRARTDEEILAWLRPWTAEEARVAIDAPIVVRNSFGARACERAIGQHFGRYNASCHSASTTNPAFASGTRAERLTHRLGMDIDPESSAARRAIAVYPHPALVSLFDLPTVLTYKDKAGPRRRPSAVSTVAAARPDRNARRRRDRAQRHTVSRLAADPHGVATAATKAQLHSVEDSVAAIVCAYIARYSRLNPRGVRVFGDVDSGYILTPVTAQIAAAADRDAGAAATTGPADERVATRGAATVGRVRTIVPEDFATDASVARACCPRSSAGGAQGRRTAVLVRVQRDHRVGDRRRPGRR